MRGGPPCPQCAEFGWLVGRDSKGRELFACRTAICDVVEYDAGVIRRREGVASILPDSTRGIGRGTLLTGR